jgi:hypothetical protein
LCSVAVCIVSQLSQGVVDLEGLGGTKGGLGQQRSSGGDRVDAVRLGQAAGPSLLGAALGGDLADIQTRAGERDDDMLAPARGALDTRLVDTVCGEQIGSIDLASTPIRERGRGELDAVVIDDADGEGVLARVDPRRAALGQGVRAAFAFPLRMGAIHPARSSATTGTRDRARRR